MRTFNFYKKIAVRKQLQITVLVLAFICSIVLSCSIPIPIYIDHQIIRPAVFWWITLMIIIVNYLIHIVFLKTWQTSRLMAITIFIMPFLAMSIPMFSLAYLNNTPLKNLEWFNIFLQSIIWYLWNEKWVYPNLKPK